LFALALTPAIIFGAFIGIYLVKKMSDLFYRWFIIGMTAVAALIMILK